MKYPVLFVGAGPGAVDLITLRGMEALKQADLVIYAGSLVNEKLLDQTGAELLNSASMELAEVIGAMKEAHEAGRRVLRLHTGDPSLYGAVAEQYRELELLGIPYEVIPGVSSVLAAAAALKAEFTVPGVSQSVILTRDAGRTPVPPEEELTSLAAHGCTICLFLSVDRMTVLVEKLRRAGRSDTTPVAVVYRASWPNERIVRGTLADIAEKVAEAGIKRQAQVIIGEALNNRGEQSLLYAGHFAHGYRDGEEDVPERCAIFALTAHGVDKAAEIAAGLGEKTRIFLPEKYADRVVAERCETFGTGEFGAVFTRAFPEYDAFVMVMAAGIVVRHLAGLCMDKRHDPAVVVCDELGNHAISLLSGHQGGGNALARRVARITNGKPVVTTATDVHGIFAFDELAKKHRYRIVNPEVLASVTTALLDGEPFTLAMPRALFGTHYAKLPNVAWRESEEISIGALRMVKRRFTVGIGCHRGEKTEVLEQSVERAFAEVGISWEDVALLGSAELKRDETGLLELACKHGKVIRFFSREALNGVEVATPSEAAMKHFGIQSVSEAAALLAAGPDGSLILPRQKNESVTVAVAEVKA